MREDGLAIFIYDLVLLGRTHIVFNGYFVESLFEYLSENSDVFKSSINAICKTSSEDEDFSISIYTEDIKRAALKAGKMLKRSNGWIKIFDKFDARTVDEIGIMASGFDLYLTKKESLTCASNYSLYKSLRQ